MATSSLSGLGRLACLAVLAGTSFCLWQPSGPAVERQAPTVHRVYRRRLIKRPLVDNDVGFKKLEKNLSAHMFSITENRRFFAHIDYPAGKKLLAKVWDITTKRPRNATTVTKGNNATLKSTGAVSNSTKAPGTDLSGPRKRRPRRHAAAVAAAAVDNMEEAEVEEVMKKRRDRSPADERKKTRRRHRKKRLREADGQRLGASNSELDRYFGKEKTDDFFENLDEAASTNNDDEDIESVYAREPITGGKYFARRPSGILTDVTHIEKDTPYFEEEDIEAALVRRAVPLSNYADPGVDGSLTLNKLASVLNLNESIKKLQLFSDNPSISVPWEEPEIMSNCWLHKMLAGRYAFSPSCKEDGNYFNKQCHLERCWCVENDGRTRDRKFLTRFSYKKFGQILYCTPPLRQAPPKALPKTPQSQAEAELEEQNATPSPSIPSPQTQNQTTIIVKPIIPSAQSPTAKP